MNGLRSGNKRGAQPSGMGAVMGGGSGSTAGPAQGAAYVGSLPDLFSSKRDNFDLEF